MASEQKIGAAFIEVATKGLQKVQNDLNVIKQRLGQTAGAGKQLDDATKKSGDSAGVANKQFAALGSTINSIGSIATKSFFGGIGAITGFVRMADPKGFEDLEVALAKLAIQLGRFFVPLLREATEWIERLTNWFKGLSDSQRETVLLFTKIGLGIALVLMIVPKLLMAFQLISMAVAALGAETAIASGGLTVLLGVVAAAIPLLLALFGATGGAGALGGVFDKIAPAIQQLTDAFKRAFALIADTVGKVLDKLIPVVTQIFGVIAQVIGTVINVLIKAFEMLLPIILTIVGQIGDIFNTLAPLFEKLVQVVGAIFEKIVAVYAKLYAAFYTVFSKILGAVMQILPPVIDLITSLLDVVTAILFPVLDLIAEVLQAVIDSLMPIVQSLLDILVPIITTLTEVFKAIVECVLPLIEAFMEIWKLLQEILLPIFQLLASVVEGVVSVVATVFKALADVLVPIVKFLVSVLKPAFEAFGWVIKKIIDAIKWVINGLIDFMNGFIDWYNDQDWLPGTLTRINRIGEEDKDHKPGAEGDGGGDWGDDKKKNDGDKFRGEMKVPAAQLSGIAEAWKKAQTAQREDAQSRIQREQLEESKKANKNLEDINNKTKPADHWGGAGGDF